jgi:subfamily B ATP-binding cassette protein MsbA
MNYFFKKIGFRMILVLLMSTLVGLLDVFGLTMFYPLLTLVLDPSAGESGAPELGNLSFIVDGISSLGFPFTLYTVIGVILGFFTLKGVFKFLEGYFRVNVQQKFMRDNRMQLLEGLSNLPYVSFLKIDTGTLQNTLTGEVLRVNTAFQSYMFFLQQAVVLGVYVIFAIVANPPFAVMLVVGALLTNVVISGIYKRVKSWSGRLTDMNSEFHGQLTQLVRYFKYLKATGVIREFKSKLRDSVNHIETSNRTMGILFSLVQSLREPLLLAVLFTVVIIEVEIIQGNIELMLLTILFFYRALTAAMQMQLDWTTYLQHSGSVNKLMEVETLLQKTEYGKRKTEGVGSKEWGVDVHNPSFTTPRSQPNVHNQSSITLTNVDLTIDSQAILRNISIDITNHAVIGIVGPSGAGKTSLANLISGLIHPTSGSISIGGKNLSDWNAVELQKRLGYITQEPVVFNDTIFNNVTLWDTPTASSRSRFESVMRKVNMLTWIGEQTAGAETMIHTDGMSISGGQRQRLAIARELYRNVDLLILDEATSSLDGVSAQMLTDELEALRGTCTMVIIAHNLSSVRHADQILVMNAGKLEAVGSWTELEANSATFRELLSRKHD